MCKEQKQAFVYILHCNDSSYYTGVTIDLEKRLKIHNEAKGAKYTRGRLPVSLVYSEKCPTYGDALRREIAIKKLTRPEKEKLINSQ